jgi:predicted dehydrogenase
MAKARPDIVSVCTPDATHEAVLGDVLSGDGVRAVLAEKPLALSLEGAQRAVAAARSRGVVLAVNYSRRYSRRLGDVKALIESGKLGAIQKVAGLYTKGVMHNGSHWFDLARWLVGEVRAVRGFDGGDGAVDDPTLDAWLRFDNGATGFLQGCSADAYAVFEMDILGTLGRVRIVDLGHRIELSHVAPSPRYSGYDALHGDAPLEGDLEDTMVRAVEDLVACVREGREPLCRGEDGVAALRIASALIESAREAREIVLEAA